MWWNTFPYCCKIFLKKGLMLLLLNSNPFIHSIYAISIHIYMQNNGVLSVGFRLNGQLRHVYSWLSSLLTSLVSFDDRLRSLGLNRFTGRSAPIENGFLNKQLHSLLTNKNGQTILSGLFLAQSSSSFILFSFIRFWRKTPQTAGVPSQLQIWSKQVWPTFFGSKWLSCFKTWFLNWCFVGK